MWPVFYVPFSWCRDLICQCVIVAFTGPTHLLSKVYSVLGLFLLVPCIDLQCVVVALPGPTHFLSKVYSVLGLFLVVPCALIYSVWLWHFLVILIYFLKCILFYVSSTLVLMLY